MTRNIVCSAILIAFIYFARKWLNAAFSDWGFWSGMVTCAIACAVILLLAWWWDRLEQRRSQA